MTGRLMIRDQPASLDGQPVRLSGALAVQTNSVIFGATATPSTTGSMLAVWPGCGYGREYGQSGGSQFTPDGTGKYAHPGFAGVWHTSYKSNPADIGSYRFNDPRYWTWHHEPVDDMTAAMYSVQAGQLPALLANHPDAGLVLGNGPILTRWQIADQNPPIDPADWAYPGMTFFAADSYNPGGASASQYRSPERMFGPVAEAARALGVPWMIPEWGGERRTADPTGAGRAAWITDCIQYLQEQTDCLAVGWWDIGGCRVSHQPTWPEHAALSAVLG